MSIIARELDYRTPQEVGTPDLEFPFELNGDFTTLIITRHLKQTREGWLQDRLANRYPAGLTIDPETGGYLIATSKPQVTPTSLFAFDRTFARIPLPQTEPSSLLLTKPVLPLQQADQVVGSYYVNRPNSAVESYDAYLGQAVTTDSGPPSFYPSGGTYDLVFAGDTAAGIAYSASPATVKSALNALASITAYGGISTVVGSYNSPTGLVVTFNAIAQSTLTSSLTSAGPTPAVMSFPGSATGGEGVYQIIGGYNTTNAAITGGTFTITILGQTTAAIAWNASVATVQTAINALSNVAARGGVTVAFPYASGTAMAEPSGPHFGLSFNFAYPAITGTASSLTPAPSSITTANGFAVQSLIFASTAASTRSLFIPAHGIVAGDTIFILAGSTYYAGITDFTVPSNNVIQLNVASSAAYAAATTVTLAGKRTKAGYKPGTTGIRCLRVTNFYLPGVSAGIPDFSAIPLSVNQSDAATFLAAVFAGAGSLNWQVGELTKWNSSLILQQTTTTLAIADI